MFKEKFEKETGEKKKKRKSQKEENKNPITIENWGPHLKIENPMVKARNQKPLFHRESQQERAAGEQR